MRPEHNEIAAASKKRSAKNRVRGQKREADHHSTWEKADDTEEEPGMCTQRNRRGMGSSIHRKDSQR